MYILSRSLNYRILIGFFFLKQYGVQSGYNLFDIQVEAGLIILKMIKNKIKITTNKSIKL